MEFARRERLLTNEEIENKKAAQYFQLASQLGVRFPAVRAIPSEDCQGYKLITTFESKRDLKTVYTYLLRGAGSRDGAIMNSQEIENACIIANIPIAEEVSAHIPIVCVSPEERGSGYCVIEYYKNERDFRILGTRIGCRKCELPIRPPPPPPPSQPPPPPSQSPPSSQPPSSSQQHPQPKSSFSSGFRRAMRALSEVPKIPSFQQSPASTLDSYHTMADRITQARINQTEAAVAMQISSMNRDTSHLAFLHSADALDSLSRYT